jgi:hypothetical protein
MSKQGSGDATIRASVKTLKAVGRRVNLLEPETVKGHLTNYVRPHEALKWKAPSEVAGIKVEGENKWLTLIQNASRKTAKS